MALYLSLGLKVLYKAPKASVHTNNVSSESFKLQWGTTQSYPIFPLLFEIAIEPLTGQWYISCRYCAEGFPICRRSSFIFSSDPLQFLKPFQFYNLLVLNFYKCELLPLNASSLQISYSNFLFKVVSNRFNYLRAPGHP